MVEDDVAGRVAGAVADVEGELADARLVAVDEPARGFERLAGDAVFGTVLVKPLDPVDVGFVRSLDRHAELFRQDAGAPAMVDMAMRQQDLLDRHTGLLRRRP